MEGKSGSSEEVVEDESGEEDTEGESSASFKSEDDEDDDFGGGDSEDFETPQKPKKRPRVSQPSASLVSKSSSKNSTAPPAKSAASPKPAPKAPSTSAITKKSPPQKPPRRKGKGKAVSSEALSSHGEDEIPATPGAETAKGSPTSIKSIPREALTRTPKSAVSATSKCVESASNRGQGEAAATSGGAKTPKRAVSDYMMRSNRPYSCINVFDNLHKKIPRAMVQKLLDELTRDGTLKVQEYNKAKIYYANQDALPDGARDVSDEKLRKLEEEAKNLTSKLEFASAEARASQARAQALAAQPTDADLDDKLASTAREVEQMEARNTAIKAQGHSASAGEGGMKAARAEFKKFRALWVNRKRNAMDVVDMIADGMEKKPKVIMEMLGLEPDEDPIPAKM